ncbi:MAG: response regulator transcription factor [Propionibacteriales bacterium]|nr:response regulator transcription factor [Propionibacteriales bacterium]
MPDDVGQQESLPAEGTSRPISVLIVDDEAFVRGALRTYLTTDDQMIIVGEASDGEAAIHQVRELNPDLVLMDLQMPGMDGVEATRRIVEENLPARILVVTGHVADTFVIDSLVAGASGYVVKDADPAQIIDAVKGVVAGDRPIDPAVTHHLIAKLQDLGATSDSSRGAEELHVTEREKEVLERLCQGMSNREIAADMYISETTVKYHLVGLMRKFTVRGRVELVVSALRLGVVT